MNIRRISFVLFVIALMALFAGAVSAQEGQPPRGGGEGRRFELVNIISDQTGLSVQDILAQVRDGATLAEVITSNGGTVDAVVEAAVMQATERINARVAEGTLTQEEADQLLASLEQRVTDALNREFEGRPGRGVIERFRNGVVRSLTDAIVTETGLDRREIVQQVRDGSTLAQVIEANGGSVDNVVARVTATVTEELGARVADGTLTQEQMDQILTDLETLLPDLLNGQLPMNPRGMRDLNLDVVREVADQTGLTPGEIRDQLRDGSTLADMLTANGVDVDQFVDNLAVEVESRITEAVADGRLTQERADELLANLRDTLTDLLNFGLPVDGQNAI